MTQNGDAAETTPLLDNSPAQPEEIDSVAQHKNYTRFSASKKRLIVFFVCVMGFLPLFAAGSFIPSIPQISEDIGAPPEITSLAVSLSILVETGTSLVWASYSTFYGRRPVYLCGLPLLILGSVGVGRVKNATELMLWRVVQAFGLAGGITLGAGVIGDIYKLEERGTVTGFYFGTILLGLGVAPLAGGYATHYASWRALQYSIALVGAVLLVTMLLFFPETIQPQDRGLDKLNAKLEKPRRFVFVNPFESLTTLKSPTLFAVMVASLFAFLTDFILFIPLPYTIGKRYKIDNEFYVGACFIPRGVGNVVGAPIAGVISDRLVIKWRKRRNGVWLPEDRLRVAFFGAITFVPLSILGSGLATHFLDGTAGLVLNLIMFFFNGIGVDFVLNPILAYGVDVMHHRSAETLAATSAVRGVVISLVTTGILPSIHHFGVLWTDAVGAALAWISALLLWYVIQYGDQMRSWSSVEHSTSAST